MIEAGALRALGTFDVGAEFLDIGCTRGADFLTRLGTCRGLMRLNDENAGIRCHVPAVKAAQMQRGQPLGCPLMFVSAEPFSGRWVYCRPSTHTLARPLKFGMVR